MIFQLGGQEFTESDALVIALASVAIIVSFYALAKGCERVLKKRRSRHMSKRYGGCERMGDIKQQSSYTSQTFSEIPGSVKKRVSGVDPRGRIVSGLNAQTNYSAQERWLLNKNRNQDMSSAMDKAKSVFKRSNRENLDDVERFSTGGQVVANEVDLEPMSDPTYQIERFDPYKDLLESYTPGDASYGLGMDVDVMPDNTVVQRENMGDQTKPERLALGPDGKPIEGFGSNYVRRPSRREHASENRRIMPDGTVLEGMSSQSSGGNVVADMSPYDRKSVEFSKGRVTAEGSIYPGTTLLGAASRPRVATVELMSNVHSDEKKSITWDSLPKRYKDYIVGDEDGLRIFKPATASEAVDMELCTPDSIDLHGACMETPENAFARDITQTAGTGLLAEQTWVKGVMRMYNVNQQEAEAALDFFRNKFNSPQSIENMANPFSDMQEDFLQNSRIESMNIPTNFHIANDLSRSAQVTTLGKHRR